MRSFLEKLHYFVSVAELGSFTRAADMHGVTRSMISQRIQQLEKDLGVKLFNRSTRHVTLTQAGERCLAESANVLEGYENLIQSVQMQSQQLQGHIRVSMQSDIGYQQIIPLMHTFQQQNPDIEFDAFLSDSLSNLSQNNYDFSFRILNTAKQQVWGDLYAVELKRMRAFVFASPDYLARHGTPNDLTSLSKADWGIPSMFSSPNVYEFYDKKQCKHLLQVRGKFRVNSIRGLTQALICGAGVGVLLEDLVQTELDKGYLVKLPLPFSLADRTLYIAYLEKHFMPLRNRRFLEFVKMAFVSQSGSHKA